MDYILVKYRFRNSVKDVQTLPGEDIDSDYNLLVEELYGITEEILEEDGKGNTNTIIMGVWNSVVGDESYRNIVGPHGLGKRGQMLITFCERN